MEKNDLSFVTYLFLAGLYLAYFVGIVIRKIALPGKNSPPLSHQLLLGVPFALVIVTPFYVLLDTTLDEPGPYVAVLGIAMEHGMLVTETAMQHLGSLKCDLQRDCRGAGNLKRPPKKWRTAPTRTDKSFG